MKRTIGWIFSFVLALNLTACGQKKPGGDAALNSGMPWWVWVIIAVAALAIAFVALVYFKVIKLDLSFLKSKPKTTPSPEGFASENLAADGLPIVPPPPDMITGGLPPVPPPTFAVGELPAVPPPPGVTTEAAVIEKPSKKKKASPEPAPAVFGADNLPPLPPISPEVPQQVQPVGSESAQTPVMPPPIPFPFVVPPPVQAEGGAPVVESLVEPEKKTTRRKKGEGEAMPVPEVNATIPPVGMPLPPVPPPPSLNIPPMPVPSAPVDVNATVKAADKGLPPVVPPAFTVPAAPVVIPQGDINATVKAADKGLPPVPPMPMPVPPPPAAPQAPAVAAFCGNCGTKLPPQAKFCPTCGAKRIGA